jgi:hypothetical protein
MVMLDRKFSDQLAAIFARALPTGRIIDRSIQREFLAQERIPYELLKLDGVRRWVARELGATAVLINGNLDVGGPVPQALFTLFDVKDSDRVEYFGTELPATAYSPEDLQAPDSLGQPRYLRLPGVVPWGFPLARRPSVPPPVTTCRIPQIVKGLPGGLNEVAKKSLRTGFVTPLSRTTSQWPVSFRPKSRFG